MARIVIVGDGPAGLSAALFLAKNSHDTVVYGQDRTLMHYAELHNYLGVPNVAGSELQRIAREQVTESGAELRDTEVASVTATADGFVVTTEDGEDRADYVVLAGGRSSKALADALGATERSDGGVLVDGNGRTSVERLYAAGHLVRPERSQAIISAGAGAAAALDVLSREAGKDVHDWDSPKKD